MPCLLPWFGAYMWLTLDQKMGRAAAMTAQFRRTADEEYEKQLRYLVRIVSA